MKTGFFFLILTVLTTGLFAQNAATLLKNIDDQRAIPDMTFDLSLISYDGDKVRDKNSISGFVKITEKANKTLIYFTDPSSVKGRKMLMDANTVYLLFPKTRNPIRLSPLQILIGEASNGDVARTGFAQEYDPTQLTSADRDGTPCWLFDLTAKADHQDSSYRKVRLWVEKSTLHPIYAEFFASGERLLKKAEYGKYGSVDGKSVPFELKISGGENPQKHTVMTYLKIGTKKLPDTVFRRDYLETWSPEALP